MLEVFTTTNIGALGLSLKTEDGRRTAQRGAPKPRQVLGAVVCKGAASGVRDPNVRVKTKEKVGGKIRSGKGPAQQVIPKNGKSWPRSRPNAAHFNGVLQLVLQIPYATLKGGDCFTDKGGPTCFDLSGIYSNSRRSCDYVCARITKGSTCSGVRRICPEESGTTKGQTSHGGSGHLASLIFYSLWTLSTRTCNSFAHADVLRPRGP